MQIDWSQLQTAEALAEQQLRARENEARAECRRRILAVINETAHANASAAAVAGLLSDGDMQTYRAALLWVAAMRGTWRRLAADFADLSDDANWPAVPAGVRELAGRF